MPSSVRSSFGATRIRPLIASPFRRDRRHRPRPQSSTQGWAGGRRARRGRERGRRSYVAPLFFVGLPVPPRFFVGRHERVDLLHNRPDVFVAGKARSALDRLEEAEGSRRPLGDSTGPGSPPFLALKAGKYKVSRGRVHGRAPEEAASIMRRFAASSLSVSASSCACLEPSPRPSSASIARIASVRIHGPAFRPVATRKVRNRFFSSAVKGMSIFGRIVLGNSHLRFIRT